jgi:riboflavin synthase
LFIKYSSVTACCWFRVDVIPTTLRETNLGILEIGDTVNLETDVLGKYARRGFSESIETSDAESRSGLTMETLIENGFV